MHDLSFESSKECSLTGISKSYDRAKNDGRTKQAEKHSAPMSSEPCAQNGKFSLTVSKCLFATGLQFNRMTHLFEAFSAES